MDHYLTEDKPFGNIFLGELNGHLIGDFMGKKDDIPFRLSFAEVVYLESCELDTYGNVPIVSDFEYIKNSPLLNKLCQKNESQITAEHKHYRLCTYDIVFDLIATDYKMEILEKRIRLTFE